MIYTFWGGGGNWDFAKFIHIILSTEIEMSYTAGKSVVNFNIVSSWYCSELLLTPKILEKKFLGKVLGSQKHSISNYKFHLVDHTTHLVKIIKPQSVFNVRWRPSLGGWGGTPFIRYQESYSENLNKYLQNTWPYLSGLKHVILS